MADREKGDSGLVVLGSDDSENKHVVEIKPLLDGVFKYFVFSPLPGKMIYLSDELKPPTSIYPPSNLRNSHKFSKFSVQAARLSGTFSPQELLQRLVGVLVVVGV